MRTKMMLSLLLIFLSVLLLAQESSRSAGRGKLNSQTPTRRDRNGDDKPGSEEISSPGFFRRLNFNGDDLVMMDET